MPELSSENLEKQSTPSEEESLHMKKTIEIEQELIEDSGKDPEQWIKENGERFREIITKNPEFLSNKEKIKKELEKETIH